MLDDTSDLKHLCGGGVGGLSGYGVFVSRQNNNHVG